MTARLFIYAIPGARVTEVLTGPAEEIRVRIAARAHDGNANKELCTYLARSLRVPPSCVSVVRGITSRHKVVEIDALSTEDAMERLASTT